MADHQSDNGVRNSNTALLQKLASAVNGHAAAATFACGGSVPLSDPSAGKLGHGAQNTFPSVTLRWDSKDSFIKLSKISFPFLDGDDVSRRMPDSLLHHCQPATFGVDDRDVLDEHYRKAAKLDTSEFSTDFHPHDCGILDSIQQILLPSMVKGGQGIGIGPQGVRAELYKLNIYSAPSGGTLRVKHRGQAVDFAWGKDSTRSIQWAAFYGDCEHEVLEVTSGHRITLTYNLYYSSIGNLAQPVSDPYQLPLFGIARDMPQQRNFMRLGQDSFNLWKSSRADRIAGGIIGFFCHHQYAHSQSSGRKSIPGGFKGVDLAIYSVFHNLGLKVGIHPIIKNKSENHGGLPAKVLMRGPMVEHPGDFVEDCLECLLPQSRDNVGENDMNSDYEDEDDKKENTTIVGTKLHGPTFADYYEEESREPVTDEWPHQKVPQIVWMNEPMHSDFAHAGLKYGNEASLNYQFSAAAILVVVPASDRRRIAKAKPVVPRSDATSPRTVIATPAASSSMSIDEASPRTLNDDDATLGSNWDRGSWPPVTDHNNNTNNGMPRYNRNWDDAFSPPKHPNASQVVSSVASSQGSGLGVRTEFNNATQLVVRRGVTGRVPAVDAPLGAMSDPMWSSAGDEMVEGEEWYEG